MEIDTPLISERGVKTENSGNCVILSWSHVPTGVGRISIPMKKPLFEWLCRAQQSLPAPLQSTS